MNGMYPRRIGFRNSDRLSLNHTNAGMRTPRPGIRMPANRPGSKQEREADGKGGEIDGRSVFEDLHGRVTDVDAKGTMI